MSAQWKPGDVALFRVDRWPNAREWPDDTSQVLMRFDGDKYWDAVDGDPSAPLTVPPGCHEYMHPLVVIDPEDAEQVDRMCHVLTRHGDRDVRVGIDWLAVQAALREFARPTPPRCVAHGVIECDSCARISAEYLRDGQCTDCGSWGETGMHYDTCPGRIRGAVYANRDEAQGVQS